MKRQAGITLLEVLIAVMLLSVVSVGMMMAMRLGMTALAKTDSRLMDNRRVAGAQRIIAQQLEGLIPVTAPCGDINDRIAMFSGQPGSVTFVSAFSLQAAWRGRPQLLQIFVAPDEKGGVRLVVNETPYTGPRGISKFCGGADVDPESSFWVAHFAAPAASPTTFVLADHLRGVQFQYRRAPLKPDEVPRWLPQWTRGDWPSAIRIVMAPLEPSPARLQPISVTAPIFLYRNPRTKYED